MKEQEELRKLLRGFGATDVLFPAVVTAVDKIEDSCDIEAEGEYTDVKLRSLIEATGNRIVIYPKIGSMVLCGRLSNSNSIYVLKVSEIEEIYIKIDNTDVVLNGNEIVFNKGLNQGMVITPYLVARLNFIENAFNQLLNSYNNHTHQVSTAGSATAQTGSTTSLTPSGGSDVTETILTDIENTKIKH
jgi:hypothetical protein